MTRASIPAAPAFAVAVLAAGLVAQALIPAATPLPEVAPSSARALPLAAGRPGPAVASPRIAAATLFAPQRHYTPAIPGATGATGAAGTATPADALAGATLTGVARARGYAAAVVRGANGQVRTLRAGELFGTWRVLGIGPASASFGAGAERRTLQVGQTAPVQAVPTQTDPEVEQP